MTMNPETNIKLISSPLIQAKNGEEVSLNLDIISSYHKSTVISNARISLATISFQVKLGIPRPLLVPQLTEFHIYSL